MAKCFDVVGYVEPCNAVRQKYTGRALLITGTSTEAGTLNSNIVFSENGLRITNMYDAGEFPVFVTNFTGKGGKALPISIDVQNPFGVTVQGNADSGRVMYTKTIPVSIPATNNGKAEEFIMGLQKGLYGSAAIVLESYGDLDVNDFFGAYSPVHIDPASVTRNEYENGGAWNFNIVSEEPVPNVVCDLEDLSAALDTLNA